jgi:hypothetical protein
MQAPLETIRGGKAWYKPPIGPMVLGEAPIYRPSDSTLLWVDALNEPPELHILKIDSESGGAIGEVRILVLEDSFGSLFQKVGEGELYLCLLWARGIYG